MKRLIVPLALVMLPAVAFAQRGRGDEQRGQGRNIVVRVPAEQQPGRRVERREIEHQVVPNVDRDRFLRAERERERRMMLESHGDVTRSLRADERANDLAARSRHHKARKHHKKG
jgi:hypothetical protein